jgi:hypothetical protein
MSAAARLCTLRAHHTDRHSYTHTHHPGPPLGPRCPEPAAPGLAARRVLPAGCGRSAPPPAAGRGASSGSKGGGCKRRGGDKRVRAAGSGRFAGEQHAAMQWRRQHLPSDPLLAPQAQGCFRETKCAWTPSACPPPRTPLGFPQPPSVPEESVAVGAGPLAASRGS